METDPVSIFCAIIEFQARNPILGARHTARFLPRFRAKPERSEPVIRQNFDEETHASLQRELDYSGEPPQTRQRQQNRRNNRSNSSSRSRNYVENDSDWQIGNIRLSNTAFIIIVVLLLAGLGFFLYQYFEMSEKRKNDKETT